jgi:O-methyltransferase involved in polyketide biosynthesis
LASGTEIIFDYREPADSGSPLRQRAHAALAARVAAIGEPFKSAFEPPVLLADVKRLGFSGIEDLDSDLLNARYFVGRADGLRLRGHGHVMRLQV